MNSPAVEKPQTGAIRSSSKSAWLNAAHEMLINSGIGAVKVMPLARRLGVSRTSFYWHFEDREALLNAILELWQDKNTGNLVRRTQAYGETITEAMFNLYDCWLDDELFDARLDRSIRSWGYADPAVQLRVEKADEQRKAAIMSMFQRFDYGAAEAEARAMAVLYTQVGYISMGVKEPFEERITRMPDYAAVFTGQKPSDAEIRRFMARHREKFGNAPDGAGGA